MQKLLYRFFTLSELNTTIRTEVVAGLTTFLAMAYIVLVNPAILHYADMPVGPVFVATAITAAVGCLLMGLLAKYPVGIAPSMGLNVYFAFILVGAKGVTWQMALTMAAIAAVVLLIVAMSGISKRIIQAIPHSLNLAICAGIGLFIALIALKSSGVVVADPNTMLTLGHINTLPSALVLIGLCLIIALEHYRIPAGILIGIVVTTVLGLLLGVGHFYGIVSLPPNPSSTIWQFDTAHLLTAKHIEIIFTFFLIMLFDSVGTMVSVLHHTGIWHRPGKSHRIGRSLVANSVASMVAAVMGSSPTSPYIESATGVKAGGRSGLTAVVIAICFILVLFFSPLAKTIPSYATAPALIYVAALMMSGLIEINWQDMTEAMPAVITTVMIPFSFSIANGIGLGFISYVLIKVFCGKWRDIKPLLWVLAALFAAYFIFI